MPIPPRRHPYVLFSGIGEFCCPTLVKFDIVPPNKG